MAIVILQIIDSVPNRSDNEKNAIIDKAECIDNIINSGTKKTIFLLTIMHKTAPRNKIIIPKDIGPMNLYGDSIGKRHTVIAEI
ncbi:hypothetical protein CSV79_08700 [Sporosarcina sp. P13]|nr:hypothetical protein CSV79_08700 [Sporosarcina sp. P13]